MKPPWFFPAFFILALGFLAASCGPFRRPLDLDPFHLENFGGVVLAPEEAERIHRDLLGQNAGLNTLKGLGNVRLQSAKQAFSSRVAWAVHREGKMRFEAMGPGGIPILSLAADEGYLYFLDRGGEKLFKKKINEKGLSEVLDLPLSPLALTTLLSGRMTGLGADRMALTENPGNKERTLHLFQDRSRTLTRVFLPAGEKIPKGMEVLGEDGHLKYRVFFQEWRKQEGYMLPLTLFIENGNQTGLRLETSRVWINPAVSDTLFTLTRPRE